MTSENIEFINEHFGADYLKPYNLLVESFTIAYPIITSPIIDAEKSRIINFINYIPPRFQKGHNRTAFSSNTYIAHPIDPRINYTSSAMVRQYYFRYLSNDLVIDNSLTYNNNDLLHLLMGYNLAKYYKYLDNYLISQPDSQIESISISKQLTVFHFLSNNEIKTIESDRDQAKILGVLFEKNSESIRVKMSEGYMNVSNLEYALNLFTTLGMEKMAKSVNKELKKIYKK